MVYNNRKLSSREKRLLLKQLLREEAYEARVAPLSYAQERLWFLSQLELESPFYTETGAVRVLSEVEVALLAEALNEVARRHEVLRTTFGAEDGRPFQRISATASVRLALVDLQAVCESRRAKEIERLVREQSRGSFDLAHGPLIRSTLLRLGSQEHVMVVSLHHIISDGWSIGVLLRELVTIYSAFRDGRDSPLPPLPIQYADFARWERELSSDDFLADQLSYWRRQLANLPPLNLPTDRPRPAIQSRRGATVDFELAPPLYQALVELSRSEKGTLFMTLMAAVKVLLSRYSGQDDIAVGSAIAGRDRADLEPLIGFFVNMLVMRTSLSGDPTFRELTRRAREVALSAYAHQRVPFEKLVEELQPDRDLGRDPLFQVAMSVDRYRMEIPSTAGFPCIPLPVDSGTAKFDMTWFFLDSGKKLVGSIQYSLDLFDASTIVRAVRHLEALLETVTANPDLRLSEIALLTRGERQQLLIEWPAAESDYPQAIGIPDLFEQQAGARPEAVAIAYGEEQLSYGELHRRSSHLALRLKSFGVKPDEVVGILAERSPAMVSGLLGILKCGGAYLPLDPGYPPERLKLMLADSGARVTLTQERLKDKLVSGDTRLLGLDGDESRGSEAPASPSSGWGSRGEDAAYLIYTSGSTGTPKGVTVPQKAVQRLVFETNYVDLGPGDRVAQASTSTFDAATFEIWGALLRGGRLVGIQKEELLSAEDLQRRLREEAIDVLFVTTALFNQLVRDQPQFLATLKVALFGGEAVHVESVRRALEAGPPKRLLHVYGPTETTTFASWHEVDRVENDTATVPIGRPLGNTALYLLDPEGSPVPAGVSGELHIGGPGLARGYRGHPELTAEKFVPHGFASEAGARLYRTGDLCRWSADGRVEFQGRFDHQVKLRGFRIELGEIEVALSALEGVRQAAVVARAEGGGPKRLVAYVAMEHNRAGKPEEVSDERQAERIEKWQEVYENVIYDGMKQEEAIEDPTFNIVGWQSSYTGAPIPPSEMKEQIELTVARIRAQEPRRVLEIGCGTGLLLFRIAPDCESYCGTDFSEVALSYAGEWVKKRGLQGIRLEKRLADDFQGFAGESFDGVILNSVVQYFPSVSYLLQVLEGALGVLEPGGFIYLGDIRSLPLLEAFHTAVQLHQASDGLTGDELRRRVEEHVRREQELVLAPAFFEALGKRLPQIQHVQIQPKRGRARNELTEFRYDVILRVSEKPRIIGPELWLDWEEMGGRLEHLRSRLSALKAGEVLGLRGIPNARVSSWVRARDLLYASASPATVRELRRAVSEERGIDPEEMWALASELSCGVELSWAGGSAAGNYDALFCAGSNGSWGKGIVGRFPVDEAGASISALGSHPQRLSSFSAALAPRSGGCPPLGELAADGGRDRPSARAEDWARYATDPMRSAPSRHLVPQLRAALEAKLPDYMVPSTFVLIDELPLTPSGKVDRKRLPAPEADRRQSKGSYLAPRTPLEERLARVWSEVLSVDRISVLDNFFELGGDSILTIQVVARAKRAGIQLTPRLIFQHQNIAELAAVVATSVPEEAESLRVEGPAPLTPIQRWFLEQDAPDVSHFNQWVLLKLQRKLDASVLKRVVKSLVRHHDALRLRCERGSDGTWRQSIASEDTIPEIFSCLDLSGLSSRERATERETSTAALQASLRLDGGPLARVALFAMGADEPDRLLLSIHHLAVDGVSWRILLEDLESGYEQRVFGSDPTFGRKSTPFPEWGKRLEEYARSDALLEERSYWRELAKRPPAPVPEERADGDNDVASSEEVVRSLSAQRTEALLREVPQAYHTEIQDVLLTALARSMAKWTGSRTLLLDLEGHGREELFEGCDLSRTVGWFTSLYPVVLEAGAEEGPGEALKQVKEQLRAVPKRGVGYGVLRYLAGEKAIAVHPRVSFNYLGQLDALSSSGASKVGWELSSYGLARSPRFRRTHSLDVNAAVHGGQLRFTWTFSRNRHERRTVEQLAEDYLSRLEELIEHCCSPEAGGYSPSDFPLVRLDSSTLDRLLGQGRAVEDLYPLSPLQSGLLFHSLAAPASGVYVEQLICRLSGRLDPKTFRRAWERVMERHTVLRTAFEWRGLPEPVQIVKRDLRIPAEELDWRGSTDAERARRLAAFLLADRERGFRLDEPPLMRLTLVREAEESWRFLWSYHHVLLDGWSIALVLKEVLLFYEAERSGQEPFLDAARPYREYIAWWRKQRFEEQEPYWRKALAGLTAPTQLAMEGRPGAVEGSLGSLHREQQLLLSSDETSRLQAMGRRHRLTLNSIVQGAWALLLSRISGEDDVVYGTTFSGRSAPLPAISSMVGLFINTLPVRVRLPSDTTVERWLTGLQQQLVEMGQNEHIPLAQVQRWSDLPRGLSLFESLFVFENYPIDASLQQRGASLGIRDLRSLERTSYGLSVIAEPGTELKFRVDYDRRRFADDTIARYLKYLEVLLGALAAHPDRYLRDLPVTSAAERHQVLVEWNDTAIRGVEHTTFVPWFEAQARRTPDAIAAMCGHESLSYRELDARAEGLARRLRSRGVRPEAIVGICMDRSLEMLVGLLGVLKAGGAYLPLEPGTPPHRLAYILENTGAGAVLTTSLLSGPFSGRMDQVLCLDSMDLTPAPNGHAPHARIEPDNLAYVIFTSGSTGVPKGVAVTHRGLANYIDWCIRAYDVADGDGAPVHSSLAFDLTVTGIFSPLAVGRTVVLVRENDVEVLGETVNRGFEFSLLKITPAHLQAFGPTHFLRGGLGRPRALVIGGEALRGETLSEWRARSPSTRLINEYGPTETVVGSIVYEVPARATLEGPVAIGRPILNSQAFVLTQMQDPAPLGARGELYIGGSGVARGYWNRPELTAASFVPDPFGSRAGARLYRTGDLARWLPEGELDYLGRRDHQVKIRGFRVELGEIESVLSQHESVSEAVVVARQDRPGTQRLVAYCVPARESSWDAESLREHLRKRLPEYMVPPSLVSLPALPLTPNGKVDRKALPAPELETKQAFVAPGTEVERKIARVFTEVLGLAQAGVHDNFFELGGDSILSIQIVTRLQQEGLLLTPGQVFEHPTVAELARVAESGAAMAAEEESVAGEIPLTPIQRWFFEQEESAPGRYNHCLLLELRDRVEAEALEASVAALRSHHDALRARFEQKAAGWVQRYADLDEDDERRSFQRVDLRGLREDEQRRAIRSTAAAAQSSLDLTEGPLLRAVLFENGSLGDRLLLVVHHLVVDGVSWRILLEDLWQGYQQGRLGRPLFFPRKTSSYKKWATRLWEHARSREVREASRWWRDLARSEPLELPRDHEAGRNTSETAETVTVHLSDEETRLLLHEVPWAYRTQINDVLLTALTQVVGRWTRSGAVLLDLEGHGREELFEDVDLSRTVGWFTSLYPVRLELPESGPGEALKSIKEQLRRIPAKGIGYGLLRYQMEDRELGRELARLKPQMSFNYLGQLDSALKGLPVKLSEEPVGDLAGGLRERSHLLEVTGIVREGRLEVSWTYGRELFERETVEALAAEYRERLRALIEHCSQVEVGGSTPSDFPLVRIGQKALDRIAGSGGRVEDIYPLSPLQSGLLFESLYAPGTGVYLEQHGCTFAGALDLAAFRRAWEELLKRHAILRTHFAWKEVQEPVQVVRHDVELPWEEKDWRGLDEAEQKRRLERHLAEQRSRGFDLGRAPLFHLSVIRLSETSWRFTWCHHHVLLDGWSTTALMSEVMLLYGGYLRGTEVELDRPRAYRDYIAWLRGQDPSAAESFWRRHLKGVTKPTTLGVERAARRLSPDENPCEAQYRELGSTGELDRASREHHLTLNTVVQGAWAMLLSRYSGERRVLFGTITSGRSAPLAGIERMLGLLINTLPLRVEVSPHAMLWPWLTELQRTQAEMRRYEHSPLLNVQQWSEIPRGENLFETLVGYENYPVDRSLDRWREHLQVRDVRVDERTNYPITVAVIPGERLTIRVLYERELYDAVTVTRLLNHLEKLLEQIARDGDRPLSALSMLTDAERAQVITEWNATATRFPEVQGLHQILDAQTERTPDSVALVFGDRHLSYRELSARSNHLAHRLCSVGVGPDDRVGIFLERSLEMVLAVLATLKAGAAYVPLDARFPSDRLGFMLSDSRAAVLITTSSLAPAFRESSARAFLIDQPWDTGRRVERESPPQAAHSDDLAYVIYTSGSTGRPKGVALSHGALVNLIQWHQATLLRGARTLQYASLSFDASIHELFAAWASGGSAFVVEEALRQDIPGLIRFVEENVIAKVVLPVVVLQAIAEFCVRLGRYPRHLEEITTTGEQLQVTPAVIELFQAMRGSILHNHYGPSEAHVVTAFTFSSRPETWPGHPPIGRPLPNLEIYILDEGASPLPVGVTGELYIGGRGLARGYLLRPALTAEKFVPHPFAVEPGSRLYRTGDRARWRADGDLEFLGRADHQIKVRGFRVELGEVEAVLQKHESVREAVVVAREDRPGVKRLVAYCVPSGEGPFDLDDLRGFLRERLPDYMLPAAFVTLEALPLTPTGKVDRKSLPEWRPVSAREFVEPRTESEKKLAEVWSEVLPVERVSAHDSFFELGGHSLLAMQLLWRIREAFQVELALRQLFEEPSLAGLAAVLDASERSSSAVSIPPIARDGELPLSFAQERLWFLDQLVPGSTVYNVPIAVRLRGPLDLTALRQAVTEIVRRHEALRTTFPLTGGRVAQRIHPAGGLGVPLVDLGGLRDGERRAEARRLASAEANHPFDLSKGPLLRARFIRLAGQEHVALLTMHHIVSDAWSLGVLLREVATLYSAFRDHKSSPLPELPIQYADFARWQRDWLSGEVLERQVSYWKKRLEDLPALPLPTDRPRPVMPSFRGAVVSLEIPREIVASVSALSQREEATPFMLLLAAFQALLARYSGQRDFAVGTPTANRNHPALEGLIGFFVNTLVMRGHLSESESFRQLLRRTREVALEAYAHQDAPFERLVDELQPGRDLSRAPLFQVVLGVQNAPMPALELAGGVSLSPWTVDTGTAKFDLTFILAERNQELVGTLEYATDLFDRTTIERMLAHYRTLLTAIAASPDAPLRELSPWTAAERQQLIEEWNSTAAPYPEQCIHELFEAQARQWPDRIALVFGNTCLTYRELNRRANHLAHGLRAVGVARGARVGLAVHRSFEMVAGTLAVLKAGGAYVPLDPEYPKERLSFMIADSRLEAVLTQKMLARDMRDLGVPLVVADPDEFGSAAGIETECDSGTSPDDLAYAMFTSGSTGEPKAVAIPHRAVSRLLFGTSFARLDEKVTLLQHSPLSFDASTLEIWAPLLHGGKCVQFPERVPTTAALSESLHREGVDTIWLTSSLFNVVIDEAPGALATIRHLLIGGEALSLPHVRRALETLPRARVVNGYGPTENTTFSSCFPVPRPLGASSSIPIGPPIANSQGFVLDDEMDPLPIGAPGELHVGGAGLARCYLGRAAMTADRFVPSPFTDEPGARLYRTGDRCRWLSSGILEFQGRSDYQVKLRGFRIELGEIESVLVEHPDVREAVVAMAEGLSSERRLAAYVVTEREVPVAELRRYLAERLPSHMIPSAFVPLSSLPLSPNGKVNRKALPAPEGDRRALGLDSAYLAPRTQLENELARLWSEVLGIERVGVNDGFFELGGNSLLATQLVSRVRNLYRVELPLRDLFQSPTVAGLARAIQSAGTVRSAPPIEPVPRDGALPLSFAQQRLWFIDQLVPGNPFYNIPASVWLDGPLDIVVLRRSLRAVVRRHEALRTTFSMRNGEAVQVVAPSATLALPVIDLSALDESRREGEAHRLAGAEAKRTFQLSVGPLLRATVIRLGPERHSVFVTMHHIIADGWSVGVFLRETLVLYDAFTLGETSPFPELAIQYADFAVWQREWLRDGILEEQLGYWREQLAELPSFSLHTDRPRPAEQSFRGATISFDLSSELTGSVKELSGRSDATLFMTLMAGFQALMARYTGKEDIVVGSGIANRNRVEVEELIGFFVNMLVLRGDLSGDPSFVELLGRIRETCLQAYAHQDLPFEKLVAELQPERDLSREPLVQVVFELQNYPLTTPDLRSDMKLTGFRVDAQMAKFDLSFYLWEESDRLTGFVEYNTDLFDASTIDRMIGHYRAVLEAVVADPAVRVSELPLLSESEQRRLVLEWGRKQETVSTLELPGDVEEGLL